MTTTPNLGLSEFSVGSGSTTTFLTFRTAMAGTSSNMTILDAFAGDTSASIITLRTNMVTTVNALQISSNYYEATVASILAYLTNMIINMKVDTTNTGSVTVKINSLAVITVQKINSAGTKVNLVASDIIAGKYNLFIYDGTNFVLLGTSGENIALISGSSVMSDTTGSIVKHNSSGITSGSYNKVLVDVFGHVTAGSVVTTGCYSGGLYFPPQFTTAGSPAYAKGAMWYDTSASKLKIGGVTTWETITSS